MAESTTRDRLVTKAREVLESVGYSGLTLRTVAKEAGLSPGAPYRHFEYGFPEVIGAIAIEGFEELIAILKRSHQNEDLRERIVSVGLAYVRFGVEKPDLYRAMFSPLMAEPVELYEELFQTGKLSFSSRSLFAALSAKKDEAFQCIVLPLADAQRSGLLRAGKAETLGLAYAALVYGLVVEFIDEGLEIGASRSNPWSKPRREMSRTVIELLLGGLEVPRTRR